MDLSSRCSVLGVREQDPGRALEGAAEADMERSGSSPAEESENGRGRARLGAASLKIATRAARADANLRLHRAEAAIRGWGHASQQGKHVTAF